MKKERKRAHVRLVTYGVNYSCGCKRSRGVASRSQRQRRKTEGESQTLFNQAHKHG